MKQLELQSRAMDLGAGHAVIFNTDQIVFDPRTLIKCMYGCADWGHGHTCPSKPGSMSRLLPPDRF